MTYISLVNFIEFGKMVGPWVLLSLYFKKWGLIRLPVCLPVFGAISLKEELISIRDNILSGSLRDREIESRVNTAKKPIIVDCGINVGITVRWWFYLNPDAVIYGIDMMNEAADFTTRSLPEKFRKKFVPITAVLGSSTGKTVELNYDDPLFGGNNAGAASGYSEKRSVRSVTLDDCLAPYNLGSVELLKVDIEDSAGEMFRGAKQILPKVKNILLEIHSDKENNDALKILDHNGFRIRKTFKRHIWLEKV